MAERKYTVTYDTLHGNRYWEHSVTIMAKNAKEACQKVKDSYWNKVIDLADKYNYSTKYARRFFKYPFHITAKRKEED